MNSTLPEMPVPVPNLKLHGQADMASSVSLIVRRLIAVLAVFAFLGGATVQAMPLARGPGTGVISWMTRAAMPVGTMTAMQDMTAGPQNQSAPCHGITADCVKQMGCIGVPKLPLPPAAGATAMRYKRVVYWAPAVVLSGLRQKPDLLPPIAA